MSRILLIEDDAVVRMTMAAMLADAGHSIVEAQNGIEGMAEMRRRRPELVIVDLIMPEQDGIETLIKLRADHPDLPILAMSGGGRARNLDFLTLAAGFGATRTLLKPFAPPSLLALVDECLTAARRPDE